MRMSSKKFDYDRDRVRSPALSKTTEPEKPSVASKRFTYASQMTSGSRIKSPGTPGSSGSQSYDQNKFGSKKLGIGISMYQNKMLGSVNSSQEYGGIEKRGNKVGISALKSNSRNQHRSVADGRPSLSIYAPPPAPVPSSITNGSALNSSALNSLNNSALNGGGLTRGSGMKLGRHQI